MISIITVVYNGGKTIENTILSVVNQTYKDIEYIIIDGGSTDNTLEIINAYKTKIAKLVSEPDKGLYDAMNKGLNLATGDYVLFINSGDKLASPDTIQNALSVANNADVIYGETEIIDQNWQVIHNRRHKAPKELNWKLFRNGMLVSHQSFIARRSFSTSYNLGYKYASDFDWCLEVLKKSTNIKHANMVISHFMEGGQTSKTIIPGLKERFSIMRKTYGLFPTLFSNFVLGIKFFLFVIRNRWF